MNQSIFDRIRTSLEGGSQTGKSLAAACVVELSDEELAAIGGAGCRCTNVPRLDIVCEFSEEQFL